VVSLYARLRYVSSTLIAGAVQANIT